MNTIIDRERNALAPFFPTPDIVPLVEGSWMDRLLGDMSIYPSALPRRINKEDGSTAIDFNLAGYNPNEVSVKVDTVLKRLFVTAKSENENNRKEFSTSVSLSPYTQPEDISSSYKNGILEVVIKPSIKREEEALVDITINDE